MLCAKEEIMDAEFRKQVEEYQNTQDQEERSEGSRAKLILPGRIVQLSPLLKIHTRIVVPHKFESTLFSK
jgi:hypothetical protein